MIELGHVTDRKPPFRYAAYTRVAFSDTDAQGVVYYGRYLPYFDLARTEYHRRLGPIDIRGEFAMRASRSSTRRPRASTTCSRSSSASTRIGRTSVTYDLAAYRIDDDEPDVLMATAKQTIVLIDLSAGARAGPGLVRTLVAEFEELGE